MIKIFNYITGQDLKTIHAHTCSISCLLSLTNNRLLSTGEDGRYYFKMKKINLSYLYIIIKKKVRLKFGIHYLVDQYYNLNKILELY